MVIMVHTAMYDVAIVGAGPIGIACAVECQRQGLSVLLMDQGCLCNALYRYPRHMRFFSTAERIAIADVPFPCAQARPSRDDALHYYRAVAEHAQIPLALYQRVEAIVGKPGAWCLQVPGGTAHNARRVVIATGFFDTPVPLQVPGEELPKVQHRFIEAHPYAGMDVAIIGGGNSAAIAALECWRSGARVTLVHRGPALSPGVKYWLQPDLENRIAEGSIRAHFSTTLRSIEPQHLILAAADGSEWQLANDFVLAMTGYRSDYAWLDALGLRRDAASNAPVVDPHTGESASRPGIHLLGSVCSGDHTNDIFIENSREDATRLAQHLAQVLGR